MHRLWLAPALVCALLSPGMASATIYGFTSTEVSALGDPTYSFQLDTAKAVAAGGGTAFTDVTIDEDGRLTMGNTISLLNANGALAGPSFFFIDTDVPGPKPFATGSGADTVFNVGNFSIADGATDGEGTLTISAAPTSAAPEPAAWLLMIAGLGGVGLTLRYGKREISPRRRAAASPT